MLRLILTAIFIGLLSACGTPIGPGPNISVVQQAISMQLSQTQAQLVRQLALSQQPELEINRIAIKKQEPLVIQDLQAFYIQGIYDMTVKLPARQIIQRQKPFEVYLQRQQQAQTWRLARPVSDENDKSWETYLIEPGNYQ